MKLTSTHCRTLEAHQRQRASSASLKNVRLVAQIAADAWEREALLAERFEANAARRRAIAELSSIERSRDHDEDDCSSSENPDRNRADG
ncbi:hypothetical protein MB02_01190 [Croceicoccus estronivorus]|uniref:hypothetical protein n=1 Tax=Croceicoccus estronivorus TaxID=1172626 RepID=UPI00082D73E9|nr:hypothetical protein [Croceicoccus estronivorus]OCC25317.1 hypothetical protein MB02_01190 [Croceicoccus estronivorus]